MDLKGRGCLLSGWKMQSPQMLISLDDKQGEQIYWLQYIVRDIHISNTLTSNDIYSIYRFQMLISGDDKQGGQIYWQRYAFTMQCWSPDDHVCDETIDHVEYWQHCIHSIAAQIKLVCKNLRIVAPMMDFEWKLFAETVLWCISSFSGPKITKLHLYLAPPKNTYVHSPQNSDKNFFLRQPVHSIVFGTCKTPNDTDVQSCS